VPTVRPPASPPPHPAPATPPPPLHPAPAAPSPKPASDAFDFGSLLDIVKEAGREAAAREAARLAAPAKPISSYAEQQIAEAVAYGAKHGIEVVASGHASMVAKHGAKADGIAAAYRIKEGKIYINEQHEYWDDAKLYMHKASRSGYLSSDHPDHVIVHEVGHALHHAQVGDHVMQTLSARDWKSGQSAMATREVSMYGGSDPAEFVAEVYAGVKGGQTYDQEIMDIYHSFKGPAL